MSARRGRSTYEVGDVPAHGRRSGQRAATGAVRNGAAPHEAARELWPRYVHRVRTWLTAATPPDEKAHISPPPTPNYSAP
ncbi:hypothetical protein ABZT28_20165 [Streptomyces sp. NPDC005388]|uniref:hypothetical protein n=1 Tax=Streptomyces sp. NPDC005388 TaxID=3156717 RepID=UPI0033A03BA8